MANQYEVDPRQALFLKYYLDPKSETFSNALQSGIKAGYSEEYSSAILSKDLDWLAESVRSEHLLKKAEKRLEEFVSLPALDGEGKTDRVVADVSKFVAGRLGKGKWSERQELTGKDGKDLPTPILNYVRSDLGNQEDNGVK